MDGMLSQDEINALLAGMDISDNGSNTEEPPAASAGEAVDILTDIEKDAIGEVANISMGTSATTLYSLVNRKVNITTPVVTTETWEGVLRDYEKPCVFIEIQYTVGLAGSNILVLKEHDVKVITDLMMGGDGTNTDGELSELHLSAISEAMNQMMGSAATSLSSMLNETIDISPPNASLIDLGEFKRGGEIASFLEETFVKIAFRMQIDDLVDSTIMQLYPLDFARSLYDTFMGQQTAAVEQTPSPAPVPPEPQPYIPPQATMPDPAQAYANQGMPMQPQMSMPMQPQMGMPMQPQMGMPMQPQMGMPMQPQMGMPMQQNVNIQPAQFQSFSNDYSAIAGKENIGLIMDVPLEVTVELGRTKKSISDILDFAPGTIIELDKIAGEPIDVLVNGKFVAKGEVVVIEESFGIRVTEIIK
ncbi:MAG: flagellar motor switch phosphatase FliY [Lachnospiraceae bacterium]|nr:flagellar motor switch phosphatase FliY [Lachnospiraceae bacterium]